MPRYRANMHYTDDQGREHSKTIEVDAKSDNAEDVARAVIEEWEGFDQSGEERLPHNIDWERLP